MKQQNSVFMRLRFPLIATLALAACEPAVPDSGAGVGFDDYGDFRNEQAAELDNRGPLVSGGVVSGETVAGQPEPVIAATPVPDEPVKVDTNNPDISDEQDFGAVSSRETIESDANRREAQQGAYQVIEPTALPTRRGSSSATVVEFALATNNQIGQSIYQRSSLSGQARFQRNCAKYQSADRAQEAFLNSGGPKRDPKGIDPDGDGFACFWDPSPYRFAVGN